MTFKKNISAIAKKLPSILTGAAVLLTSQHLIAQTPKDSSAKVHLASLEKKMEPGYIYKQSNVAFPEILKGNEEQMLPYIEKFSAKRRDYLIRMHTKGRLLLPKAVAILNKYNLPDELKVLLTLESAYNGNAVSKAGAVGYWQIMDEVAREYGIKYIAQLSGAEKKKQLKLSTKVKAKRQKGKIKVKDERKNFNKATHTAARYLTDRRRNLDDNWLLIVASYNCGVGNVWKAMERSGKKNPDFWDVKTYLPAETQAYVMNFITLNVIFNNYDLFVKNKLTFIPEKIIIPEDVGTPGVETTSDYLDR